MPACWVSPTPQAQRAEPSRTKIQVSRRLGEAPRMGEGCPPGCCHHPGAQEQSLLGVPSGWWSFKGLSKSR